MDINDASSSIVRCKTAEGISAVADMREVWAALARTDLLQESATRANLLGSELQRKKAWP